MISKRRVSPWPGKLHIHHAGGAGPSLFNLVFKKKLLPEIVNLWRPFIINLMRDYHSELGANNTLAQPGPGLGPANGSSLISGNVTVGGRRTSIRLEAPMWTALREICIRESKTIHELVTEIGRKRAESTLTAAIRVFLLGYYHCAATEDGHRSAGHGALKAGE